MDDDKANDATGFILATIPQELSCNQCNTRAPRDITWKCDIRNCSCAINWHRSETEKQYYIDDHNFVCQGTESCEYCDVSSESAKGVNRHALVLHFEPFPQCAFCGCQWRFFSIRHRNYHFLKMHDSRDLRKIYLHLERPYVCGIQNCSWRADSKNALVRHLEKSHHDKLWGKPDCYGKPECPVCGRSSLKNISNTRICDILHSLKTLYIVNFPRLSP